jgi:hypothetical protein
MVVLQIMGLAMISLSGTITAYKASVVTETFEPKWFCGRPSHQHFVKLWLHVDSEVGAYDHMDSFKVPSQNVGAYVIQEIEATLARLRIAAAEEPVGTKEPAAAESAAEAAAEPEAAPVAAFNVNDYESSSDEDD